MKITVIDYGLSNLLSVTHAFEHFGAEVEVTGDPAAVLAADALVLPGVGAFRDGMQGLEKLDLVGPLREKTAQGTPLLGICLGMQMLFDESEEFGCWQGLGLVHGRVVRIPSAAVDGSRQRVPHIGWEPLYPAGGAAQLPWHSAGTGDARPGMLLHPLLRSSARHGRRPSGRYRLRRTPHLRGGGPRQRLRHPVPPRKVGAGGAFHHRGLSADV